MDIMHRDITVFNSDCEMVLLYNIYSGFAVLIDGILSIVDLEAKDL